MHNSMISIANLIFYLFSPLSKPLTAISRYFSRSSQDSSIEGDEISEKEIRFLINYIEKKGIMEPEKTGMLENIFRMGSTRVKEILIPNSEIISVDISSDVQTLLTLFADYQYSRLPVFEDNPENIVGIVYQKDLFLALQHHQENPNLKELTRPIIFVPDSLKVNELLKEFRKQHIHMAMVLDEYGSTIGLVTLEDTLEEIVGEIKDEHDPNLEAEKITTIIKDKEWIIDATISLDRLRDLLHISFHGETTVTLGGFLTEFSQHLPKKGEKIYYKGYCFTINKADKKRVMQVHIVVSEPAQCIEDKTKLKKKKSKSSK